jgi:hypothetical protein
MTAPSAKKGGRKTEAGLAGAGGGTALTAFVQLLDETSAWKKPLLLAVPVITVGISFGWHLFTAQCTVLWEEYNARRRLKEAQDIVNKGLNAKDITPDHKAALRKRAEMFEIAALDNLIPEPKAFSGQKNWSQPEQEKA